ncbi:MAG: phage antirepressor KilAC domain-containing protein [Plesiomonas shigelloides]
MNQLIAMNAEMTMSSIEIAVLTGKEHKNVMADIRRMLVEIQSAEKLADYKDGRGRTQPCLMLTKDESICLVAGYSAALRMAIIKRWQELEDQAKPQVPQTYAAALLEAGRLAMELEQSQQQLAIAAPKAEFVDRYMSAPETFGFRQVAKKLHMKENELRDFLLDNRVMYYLSGCLTAYANHVDAGRFEQVSGVAGNDHAYTQSKFTTKGVEWLAGEIAKSKLK